MTLVLSLTKQQIPHFDVFFNEDNGKIFPIEDPNFLRSMVVPLFRGGADGPELGLGTAFFINPFNKLLTAYHVVDEILGLVGQKYCYNDDLSVIDFPEGEFLFAILDNGSNSEKELLPSDCIRSLDARVILNKDSSDPLIQIHNMHKLENPFDLTVLSFDKRPHRITPKIPSISFYNYPKIGEQVLAVGYPESCVNKSNGRPLIEARLFGSVGKIIEIQPGSLDPIVKCQMIVVEADWPGGFSGGPIFNKMGDIIGLVSKSIRQDKDFQGTGRGILFNGEWDLSPFMPSIGKLNPGWFNCWGVVKNNPWNLHSVHETEEEAIETLKNLCASYMVKYGEHRFGSDDFMY